METLEGAQSDYQIVVHDPEGQYWEGALLQGPKAERAKLEGVILLPVEPRLFGRSGIGAFFKRSWGAGVPLNSNTPRLQCPLTMFVHPELRTATWVARVVKDPKTNVDKLHGFLRLVVDSSQSGCQSAGLSSRDNLSCATISEELLGDPDEEGGWTLRGVNTLAAPGEGHIGLSLYGMAPGLRVVWAAVSLSA